MTTGTHPLTRAAVDTVDWAALRPQEDAEDIRAALLDLVDAEPPADPSTLHDSYWELENTVVLQGSLFQAAPRVVEVLLALLAEDPEANARSEALLLIQMIVSGKPHPDELAHGNTDLLEQCRAAARTGLWQFYRCLGSPQRELVLSILRQVEPEPDRLARILARFDG